MFDLTVFFPTRNRPEILQKSLNSIMIYCPEAIIHISNNSTKEYFEQVEQVIQSFKDKLEIKQFYYENDPGCSVAFNDLFQKVETELALVWDDDVVFLRKINHLYEHFFDGNIQLVGLPMIDDISKAPSIEQGWKKDQYGCAVWNTTTGRCYHHAITRTKYFQQWNCVYTPTEYIDVFVHNHTQSNQRICLNEPAYLLHERIDDYTRANMLILSDVCGDVFRYPVGHKGRIGYNFKSRKERDGS